MAWVHPCLQCGACCAYFRVSFYWREGEKGDVENPVPSNCFDDASDSFRSMKGTNQKRGNRCIGLTGDVGHEVSCAIYENRPSPCRDFFPSFENGIKNPRCDKAREAHQLSPLRLTDWSVG